MKENNQMKKQHIREEVDNSPTWLQSIFRYIPHKISIWWFKITGGTKK